ncbi:MULTISPECIES: GtrA family protein [unclassified Mesorhizobium]|uniref:GtrA family protein n=1 Tax=unclassified Mesorhizobium TaxID=325217 RepID=UPI000BAF082C|nr:MULTISPECIES: GtrA family protein [unclassified Mesorhizobium]TGT56906.1 GtrA family protein [Mesorhizobium sp. M00.F.Ca.ET.170.01.1.1]AZO08676.1 GtrA family protein [Mesorhizobium sp. M3A.F.Ca.ET.080.04.2.1]PBB85555.1 polysaccharide synthesis protein GtrA [Mesorhizobium sp. WSM3876]RWB71792.1 MAG: GtrA family protein [Mesorhizobium sp.]RWB84955.1 MAG: GtrA family protein [Mesorhizobium sp.]
MPVSDVPEHRLAGGLKLLARFASVGLVATILYAVLTAVFAGSEWLGLAPVEASLWAYAAAALFSYLAHRSFTFMSAGPHRSQVPRFVLLTLAGLALAYAAPWLLTVTLGLPLAVPVLLTCLAIPALNLLVLDRWVFAERRRRDDGPA